MRKTSLQEIFTAIEWEEFERAANLCLERYADQGPVLAVRGAGRGRIDDADWQVQGGRRQLDEAIVAANTLPWAKLGVARAMMESGQLSHAVSALDTLISEDPSFADA